jgi:hypothetical protein
VRDRRALLRRLSGPAIGRARQVRKV